MNPEDIRKLLGGYATGTLTAEEQQALFAAALEDQELFDALARDQSLRDLLRDPAVRAELLSALDAPAGRIGGFWQWLRRPVVAGLAAGCVAAVAVLAVWQGTRVASVKLPEPVIVADLKPPEPIPPPSSAQPPPSASQPEAQIRSKLAGTHAPVSADKKAAPVMPPSASVAMGTLQARRSDADVSTPKIVPLPPPPPPPAAMPAPAARKAEVESTGTLLPPGESLRVVQENASLDARALFYADRSAPRANAFVQPGSGAVPPSFRSAAPRTAAAPQAEKAMADLAATLTPGAPRLGVRLGILRGAAEADLTTVLDPGETVRLRLIPNADGFLYVADGERLVASGAAQRLKPFETPELRFQGSGQKQLYVMFSLRAQAVDPVALGTFPRGSLVESAGADRATYVVNGPREAGAQQIVVPVTLTWR